MISPVILSVELKQRCLKSYTYRSRLLLLNKAYLTFSEGSIKKIHVTLNKAQEGKKIGGCQRRHHLRMVPTPRPAAQAQK